MSRAISGFAPDAVTAAANLKFALICFGDELAEREGYAQHDGIDAIHFYIVERYRWLPKDVRAMSDDDLQFLMREAMQEWTLPEDARGMAQLPNPPDA